MISSRKTIAVSGSLLALLATLTIAQTTAGLKSDDVADSYRPGNILRYGADPSGTTDSSKAIQAAFDQAFGNATGAAVYFPEGTFDVDTKITETCRGSRGRVRIHGEGAKSIINSTVVGDSTIELIDCSLFTVEGLRFTGNGLTGSSGNGHALALRDSVPNSGTFYPLEAMLHNLSFDGFRGADKEITGTKTGVSTTAASLYVGPGIAVDIDKVEIGDTGIGILVDESQNTHLKHIVVDTADEFCVEADAPGDGFSITDSDLIRCGLDSNGDPSSYKGSLNFAGIGIKSAINPVVVRDSKFKLGQAVLVFASLNVTLDGNYFRVDPGNKVADTWAIQADKFTKLTLTNNDFEYLVQGGNINHRNAMDLDVNANYSAVVNLLGNNFNHSNDVDYDVRIRGASDANSNIVVNIIGNSFGNAENGRTSSDVEDVILLDDGNFHGQISGNTFTARGDGVSAGGTIKHTLTLAGASARENDLWVFGNKSREYLTGATITNPIEDYQNSTFAGTLTGCTTNPTDAIEYFVTGYTVTLRIPAINCTSNTTSATITGMPTYIQPVTTQLVGAVTQDNGSEVLSRVSIDPSGTITLYNGLSTTFTGSGTKGISAQTIAYARK